MLCTAFVVLRFDGIIRIDNGASFDGINFHPFLCTSKLGVWNSFSCGRYDLDRNEPQDTFD